MKKHYTPEIKEFHVGFKFELHEDVGDNNFDWQENSFCETINPENKSYIKKSTLWNFFALSESLKEGNIRVKYLDKEDIETLGFSEMKLEIKELSLFSKEVEFRGDLCMLSVLYNSSSHWACIYLGGFNYNFSMEVSYKTERDCSLDLHLAGSTLFAGTIKNKSELEKICLGVLTNVLK